MGETLKKPVIGMDGGNFNFYLCYIAHMDMDSRLGGTVCNLIPPRYEDGIPSVYFYSKLRGERLCENAVMGIASPIQNRLRYLKRHMGESVQLDDRVIFYDDAIVKVVQHCMRSANKQLRDGWGLTTNLVSISYPATFTSAQRQRLIELVEKATVIIEEDNKEIEVNVKVHGTIAEPAAASLDYLADQNNVNERMTVLSYDLGGGTFDLGLVSLYPKGMDREGGDKKYYDIINAQGIDKLGGVDFNEALLKVVLNKIPGELDERGLQDLKNQVEERKIELSTSEETLFTVNVGDYYEEIIVTRKEFEEASMPLIQQTIKATAKIMEGHPNHKPDLILITGGAGRMPMVEEQLKENFPEYADRIKPHRGNRAVAYGAARYGTNEPAEDPTLAKQEGSAIIKRLSYDIGIRYYKNKFDNTGYVRTFLKAGTEIPCVSEVVKSRTLSECQWTPFRAYEANGMEPNYEEVETDYTEIMDISIDHGRVVPENHPHECRMKVDRYGVLTIEARDASIPDQPFKQATVKLKNL